MNERKPTHEMTSEERLRDMVRHFPTLLKRWAGGTAKVVELTTSHATLTIRVEDPQRDGNLQILLAPPKYYRGPFRWQNCDIHISLNNSLEFVICDPNAEVEIVTEHIELVENAKPHRRLVAARENQINL